MSKRKIKHEVYLSAIKYPYVVRIPVSMINMQRFICPGHQGTKSVFMLPTGNIFKVSEIDRCQVFGSPLHGLVGRKQVFFV